MTRAGYSTPRRTPTSRRPGRRRVACGAQAEPSWRARPSGSKQGAPTSFTCMGFSTRSARAPRRRRSQPACPSSSARSARCHATRSPIAGRSRSGCTFARSMLPTSAARPDCISRPRPSATKRAGMGSTSGPARTSSPRRIAVYSLRDPAQRAARRPCSFWGVCTRSREWTFSSMRGQRFAPGIPARD